MIDQQQGGGWTDRNARFRHGRLIGILYLFDPGSGVQRAGALQGKPDGADSAA
ncbi:MAG: hypothetical protein H6Q05_565 [Acidobacteria bacterium]|nr:hypothetical protein [Acidobacteriota bacterium]